MYQPVIPKCPYRESLKKNRINRDFFHLKNKSGCPKNASQVVAKNKNSLKLEFQTISSLSKVFGHTDLGRYCSLKTFNLEP
jgi:hypothetical protein